MTDGDPAAQVNSRAYWERRFGSDWQPLGGREQSRTFMDLAVCHLPAAIHEQIVRDRLSLLDCGCALGDGTALLAERFPASAVAGFDWSETAVAAARAAYPEVEFFVSDFAGLERSGDVLVSSNCFEHLDRPIAALESLLARARHYVLLIVPLAEGYPPHAEHVRIVHARTFPAELAGWRVGERIVLPPSPVWSGLQLLLIYRPAAGGVPATPGTGGVGDTLLQVEAELASGLAGIGERLASLRAEILASGREEAERARAEVGEARAEAERSRAQVQALLGETALLRSELAAAAARLERARTEAEREERSRAEGERAFVRDLDRAAALAEGSRREIAALAAERDLLAAHLAAVEARLAPLERSRAVAAVHRFWRLLSGLAPAGTRRRRVYGRLTGAARGVSVAPPLLAPPPLHPREPEAGWEGDFRAFAALLEQGRQREGEAGGTIVALLSGTALREDEGQRPTRLALELAGRGTPVVFGYFRWSADEPGPRHRPGERILQVPLDALTARPELLAAAFAGRRRVALVEFPYAPLFELVAALHGAGWIVVYDGLDDWEEFHRAGQAVWYDEAFERHLASAADAVFAVSRPLAERLLALGAAGVEVLPNGLAPEVVVTAEWVSGSHVAHALEPILEPMPESAGAVTVGYFGHLAAAWFDWELIAAAARARPSWRFELIGYGGAPDCMLPDNVTLLGPRPHRELASHAARWDVGVVPFKPGRLAAGADPIKTYEYLAMGLPVVVTGVFAPPGGEALVRRAEGLAGFLAALAEAATEGSEEAAARRRAFAATCTWAARVDALLAALARRGQRVGEKERLFRMAR